MKVLDAEVLPDGGHRFTIEVVPAKPEVPAKAKSPAIPAVPAVTETITWGADVPLDDARRETRLLMEAKHAPPAAPTKLTSLIGTDL